jgi:hypothetical protein
MLRAMYAAEQEYLAAGGPGADSVGSPRSSPPMSC